MPISPSPPSKLHDAVLDPTPREPTGHCEFADFLASDNDFFILRRFDTAHARTLLNLQDQVVQLEERLKTVERQRSKQNADNGQKDSARGHIEAEAMLESLRIKLEQYDNLLSQYIQLRSRPAAPRLNINNVRTWLSNEDNPIAEEEVDFVGENDLITLADFEKPLARRVFEQRLLSPTLGLWGLFSSNRRRKHGDDERPTTVQGDDGPVNFVASVAVFLTVLVMPIAPLWALAYMESLESKLGTITGFTLLLLVFSSGTAARPFEMLAATAGYCAVLVVFLQLDDVQNGGPS